MSGRGGAVAAVLGPPVRLREVEDEPEGMRGRSYRGGREDAGSGGVGGRAGGGGFYRLEVKIHGRAKQASALAAAAYREASALGVPGEDGFDFTAKRGVVHSEVVLPEGAPERLGDRGTLWREVERAERRCDAQLFREVILALPRELDREARVGLAVGFAREQFVERGMIADVAVHEVVGTGGGLAPHAHVMLTLRSVGPEGFGLKETAWNRRELLLEWREAWAASVNFALAEHGVEGRVSHESLATRLGRALASGDFATAAEVDHEPEAKVGRAAFALARRGVAVTKVAELEAAREERAEGRRLYGVVGEFGEEARARFLELRAQAVDVYEAFVAWGEEQAAGLAALARGAALAGAVGAVALGAGLARDTPDIGGGQYPARGSRLLDSAEQHPAKAAGPAGENVPPTGRRGGDEASDGTGNGVMSDEELDRMIGEMMVEDRAAVAAEAQAAEREEREAAAGAGGEAERPGVVVADEGWSRPEREAEVEVDPAAAWAMALSGGDWPGAEKAEGEAEADGERADRESASGEGPEAQQGDGERVEEADPELDRLMGELEAEDRAMGEQAVGGEELEAGG